MSDSMKEDRSQVESSSASLAPDMSLLEELFPSLGNGESSGNHLTNQLAMLLHNLGSSDDESSNGPSLYNPLQLSPPRLNEIHALATANLITQTQEAIMQEYNITDCDFDICTNSNKEKNIDVERDRAYIPNDFLVSSNKDEKFDVRDDNNKNIILDISSIPFSTLDTFSDKTKQSSEVNNQTCEVNNQTCEVNNQTCEVNNQMPNIVHHDNAHYSTLFNMNIVVENKERVLTKVKSKICETNNKMENETTEMLTHDCVPCNKQKNISERELETQSAVQDILDSPCSVQKNNITKKISNLEELCTRISRPGYVRIKKCPHDHLICDTPDNKEAFSNKWPEQTQQNDDLKRKHETIINKLPLKKRHIECNTASMVPNHSQSHGADMKINYNYNSQTKSNVRSDGFIPWNGNISKVKEKSTLYVCVICMKQFSNIDNLELHSTNHQQYSCPFPDCVRTFSYRSHLSYHRQMHEGQKNHKCSECGKVFTKAQHLETHVLTHKESKPFTCSVCNKSFTTAGNLKNHTRTHTGERPYTCDVKGCTKTFAELSSLKKHKVTHTGEKSFKCDLCGKSFSQVSSKNYHMKKHREKLQ